MFLDPCEKLHSRYTVFTFFFFFAYQTPLQAELKLVENKTGQREENMLD